MHSNLHEDAIDEESNEQSISVSMTSRNTGNTQKELQDQKVDEVLDKYGSSKIVKVKDNMCQESLHRGWGELKFNQKEAKTRDQI